MNIVDKIIMEKRAQEILAIIGVYSKRKGVDLKGKQFAVNIATGDNEETTILFGLKKIDDKFYWPDMERIVLHGKNPPIPTNSQLAFIYAPIVDKKMGEVQYYTLETVGEYKAVAISIYEYLINGTIDQNQVTEAAAVFFYQEEELVKTKFQ